MRSSRLPVSNALGRERLVITEAHSMQMGIPISNPGVAKVANEIAISATTYMRCTIRN